MALTKKDISDLLDQKLEPIKKDISTLKINSILIKKDVASVKNDLQTVKDVVEREFKQANKNFKILNEKVETVENQLGVVIGDYEPRLHRLEKQKKVSSNN